LGAFNRDDERPVPESTRISGYVPGTANPLSSVRRVGDMSRRWSHAPLDIEVAYDTVVDHAR
jgi:hypothetical protein